MAWLNVFGAGGFGKQTLPVLRHMQSTGLLEAHGISSVRFVDDGLRGQTLGEFPVIGAAVDDPDGWYAITIGDGNVRAVAADRAEKSGLKPLTLTSATAQIAVDSKCAAGAIFCDFVIQEPGSNIGSHFHANVYSFVAHDCQIGDFVTLGPRACCNGNVHIGDYAYIGAGAVIKQGQPDKPLKIGRGAVVGMGAIVTKDVPAGAVVAGNPARSLK